jgi:3-oxoacyl-[acyl-carrier-protein] synthase-3
MTTPKHAARRAAIVGTGSYLPARVLTNADLEQMVETSDEWIRTRTGIRERRIAAENEASSDMAAEAAQRALASAGLRPEQVDIIIVATLTPDMPFPNTACFVQQKIGARNAFCFDIEAACSGFIYALDIARRYIVAGDAETVLVIGAEKLSSVTDWQDRGTCVLFGDGAGAAVLRPATDGSGIVASVMGSDGRLTNLLHLPGGGSRYPVSARTIADRLHYMKMSGNEVFKHAVRCMCDAGQKVLDRCGMTIADVDWVVPHQANLRIVQAIAERLGGSMDRFCVNLDRVGNLSAASVPVALDEAIRSGKIVKGHRLLFVAFGGGFTWGAMVADL